jgi:Tubulin-tyrosine ligase family
LLEVNLSPALTVDTQVDIKVKRPLMEDIIDLIGLDESDAQSGLKHGYVFNE